MAIAACLGACASTPDRAKTGAPFPPEAGTAGGSSAVVADAANPHTTKPEGVDAFVTPQGQPTGGRTLAFVGGDNGNVHVLELDSATCTLSPKSMMTAGPMAWYGAIDSKGRYLYIGSTGGGGKVLTYAIDRTNARLTMIASLAVGVFPAHLTVDNSDKFLIVAGFGSANVIVLPIGADGALGAGTTTPTGKNPHSTALDPANRYLFVQNMGSDTISHFAFDPKTGKLTQNTPPTLMLSAKTGPRSGAFHPRLPVYYTANELSNTVTTYSLQSDGSLRLLDMQTALPPAFKGTSYVAEIHVAPTGTFAYVSNRGADTIAIFKVDQTTGALTPTDQAMVGGKNPQSQAFDRRGRIFLSANTDGKSVACFTVDEATGALTRKGLTPFDTKALWIGILPP